MDCCGQRNRAAKHGRRAGMQDTTGPAAGNLRHRDPTQVDVVPGFYARVQVRPALAMQPWRIEAAGQSSHSRSSSKSHQQVCAPGLQHQPHCDGAHQQQLSQEHIGACHFALGWGLFALSDMACRLGGQQPSAGRSQVRDPCRCPVPASSGGWSRDRNAAE